MRTGKRHNGASFIALSITLMAFTILGSALGAAQAAPKVVRFSYQFGLGFFPVTVVLEHKLIEKHARLMGLDDVTASGVQLNGAAVTDDALLSGSIDFASGGIGGLLQMWDKTNGAVKGLISINDMALLLNTNDPTIKSISDYLKVKGQRIALPAVKVGAHAIVLEMAAEKAFGPGKEYALDDLTVSLPHPEGYSALLGGHSEIRSHFTSQPFSYLELHAPAAAHIHNVLSSYDVLGGPHNNALLYTTKKWAQNNPKLLKVVFDAFTEADSWISEHPKEAAELFKSTNKTPLDVATTQELIQNRDLMDYVPEPMRTMPFADFLHKIGRLHNQPTSWKDYFWDVSHGLNGS